MTPHRQSRALRTITFLNPITGEEQVVSLYCQLGRAAERAQDGRACTAAELRRLCEESERFRARLELELSSILTKRAILIKGAARRGAVLKFR